MRLVIKRKRWARGGKNGQSQLLNSQRNMCCLGFYLNACGIAQKHLKGRATPVHVSSFSECPTWLLDKNANSVDCGALMTVNDSSLTPAREREAEIKEIFAKHGVQVVFE